MREKPGSRRDFLTKTASVVAGSWMASHGAALFAAAESAQQAIATQSAFTHLTESEALILAAVADQIFPPDELPGASELGAVYFMDTALGGFMAGLMPLIKEGVTDLEKRVAPAAFHELAFDEQTDIIRQIESSPFFMNAHFLTLCGLFALPAYGGNRDEKAWKMIGFEARHVWQAPFGYYDAEYAKENDHASS